MKQWLTSLFKKWFASKREAEDRCVYEELPGLQVRFIECGHSISREAKLTFFGGRFGTVKVPDKNISELQEDKVAFQVCPRCKFEEMVRLSIRCILCGETILPGEPVAMYWKRSPGITRRNKRFGTEVQGHYLGCLKSDCCPSGGYFAGYWSEKGFVSAFEGGGTVVDEVIRTGKTIVGNIETGKMGVVGGEDERNSGKDE